LKSLAFHFKLHYNNFMIISSFEIEFEYFCQILYFLQSRCETRRANESLRHNFRLPSVFFPRGRVPIKQNAMRYFEQHPNEVEENKRVAAQSSSDSAFVAELPAFNCICG